MTQNNDIFTLRRDALATADIDKNKRKIDGYVVIEKGELLDYRDYEVDEETMSQIVELGNAEANGLKVRWTHPEFFSDHLGKYLGRAKNFRVDGDVVRADMHFAKAAELSPVFDRDPVAYILALAEEDPQAFATSIYFMRDYKAMAKLADILDEDAPTPIRISELYASDVVDEGAAATSFFSKQNNSSALPSGEGKDPLDKKGDDMSEENKEAIEKAQALAKEEAEKANADRLEALRAEFKESDFVLEQFSKGNDVTQAKAEWADVLTDRLAQSEKEKEELKAKQEKPTKVEGEDPIDFEGEGDEGKVSFSSRVEKHMESGLSRAKAIAKAAKEDPEGIIQ